MPLAILLALGQTTLGGGGLLFGAYPNLMLLFASSWVLRRGLGEGLVMGLAGGIILDVTSAAPFGAAMLSLALGISIAAMGQVNVFQGAWYLKYGVIAGATLLANLVFTALLRLSGFVTPQPLVLYRIIVTETMLHLALMPAVYGLVKWLAKRIEPPAVEF